MGNDYFIYFLFVSYLPAINKADRLTRQITVKQDGKKNSEKKNKTPVSISQCI